MSLQSEDLARQRIEHIQAVLTGAARQLETGVSIESSAAMLLLQRAQLASTRDLLSESIQAIQTGLLAIPPQIQHLVERTGELSHRSVGEGESFLALVSGSRSTVVDVFKRCCSCARSVVSIVENLTPAVRRMTAGASALEHIQTLILLLAINAAIKTEHLGPDGAGMGVLATEMQDLARRSEGDTAFVLEQLAAMSQILTSITGEQSVSQGTLILADGSERGVEAQLSNLSRVVESSSPEMTEGLDQVRQLAALLCADVEKGCELVSRAQALTDRFKRQLERFDHVFEQLGIDRQLAMAHGRDQQGDELSNLYSMQSERDLHLEIFGGSAGNSPAETPTSEFGDGVELF
jgi:methyl-accepting chemotaxis protein